MSTLLVKNASVLVTMDDQRQEIKDGGLFIRDNVIEQVGPTAELPQTADNITRPKRPRRPARSDQHPPPSVPNLNPRHRPGC